MWYLFTISLTATYRHALKAACLSWVAALCLFIPLQSTAQPPAKDYLFRHITTANGLVSNQVSTAVQDAQGYIWIGTQTGLQRYDGKRFITYLADIHDSTALQSDWINTIFEDSRKRLWIGTSVAGASLMDRSTGHFFNFNRNMPAGRQPINGIWQFFEDSRGRIWIVAYDAIYLYNEKTNSLDPANQLLNIPANVTPSSLAADNRGNLWFCFTDGVRMLDIQTQRVFDRSHNPDRLSILSGTFPAGAIAFDHHGFIWLSTGFDQLLYRFRANSSPPVLYSFDIKPSASTPVATIRKEFIGSPFITSGKEFLIPLISRGLAIYDYVSEQFSLVEADNDVPNKLHLSLHTSGGLSIQEDREQNIWMASDRGLNIFKIKPPAFTTLGLPQTSYAETQVSNAIEAKDGDIYVAYYFAGGGIKRFDKNMKLKKQYRWEGPRNERYDENQLWYMFQDRDGLIWAPNQAGNILVLDPVSGQVKLWKDSTFRGAMNEIKQDKNDEIWIAHNHKGLLRMDPATKKIRVYDQFINPRPGKVKRVMCMLFDENKIWVGTIGNGLQLFDIKSGKFEQAWMMDEKNPGSISNNDIVGLLSYNKDSIIVGTLGGLNILNVHTGKFTSILSRDGLPNNLVQAITLDAKRNLWAAFAGGLSRIDLRSGAISNFGETDGVIDNRFNHPFLNMRDGRILIGAVNSMLLFDPASIPQTSVAGEVTISGFRVFENPVFVDSLIATNRELVLTHSENSLSIDFAALQFGADGELRYAYQLEGVDQDWITAGPEQAANYSQLPAGHYRFKVRAINRNGEPGEKTTILKVRIRPPFWQTWWFISILAALAILFLYYFIRWRELSIRTAESGKTRLQQLTAETYKTQFETEQINNFFSTALLNINNVDDVLWEVAKNLIARLGLVDCIIYLWNDDHTKLIQKAGYGPKGSLQTLEEHHFDVVPGQGIVGIVAQTKKPMIIPDTSVDSRYRVDDLHRLSEICVPIIYNDQLVGVIDSEHHERNFFNRNHLRNLVSIATLVASKIKSIEAEQRLRKQKAELADINQQLAEVQLAALRSQMNPHFIFNALNSIKKFVIANEPVNAEKYLGKFSRLIRSILDNSQTSLVRLEKELQLLGLYLELEQLRFGDRLTYLIEVDESLDVSAIMIPSMIVQPFVENAMLHGIMHREHGGHVAIKFIQHPDWMEVVIEDNGVGRKKSMEYKAGNAEPHKSIGIEVAVKRLAALKINEDTPSGIRIIDLVDEQGEGLGTKVIISIPVA
ncbi:MAG: GAF domain-containing protein [Chitinophagaceae bacterium]|nr:MAG: GAF domain-containing protein [Chitinophagaceae bacterium]